VGCIFPVKIFAWTLEWVCIFILYNRATMLLNVWLIPRGWNFGKIMEKNKSFSHHVTGYKPSNLTILHFKLSYLQNYLYPSWYTDKTDLISGWLVLHSELIHRKDYHQSYNYCWQLQHFHMFCWLCISVEFLKNNQLDAQFFFLIYLFQFSTCFEHPCTHHQENQLY